MTPSSTSTRPRWPTLAVGLVVLAAVLLWLAAAPAITVVVERQLRRAGFQDPVATGVSLTSAGVAIERLRLAPADALVLDGVRVRLGTTGIAGLSIARLRVAADVGADGRLVLPGPEAAGGGAPPLDLLPDRGVRVASAEIRLATPAGPARLTFSDLLAQRQSNGAALSARYALEHAAAEVAGDATAGVASDGALRARFDIAGGQVQAGGVRAAGLTGAVVVERSSAGAPSATLDVETGEASLADVALGRLALGIAWRDGIAELGLESLEPGTADVAVEGRAERTPDALSARVEGRIALTGARAQGQLDFSADVSDASGVADASGVPGGDPGGVAGGAPRVRGQLRLAGRGLAVTDLFGQGSIDVAASIDAEPSRLTLEAAEPWKAELTPAPARWPESLRTSAGGAVAIAISPRDGEPLSFELSLLERTARLAADVEIGSGSSRIAAAAQFVAQFEAGWSAADFTAGWTRTVLVAADALTLEADNVAWGDVLLDIDGFEGSAAYSADRWSIDGAGRVTAAGSVADAAFQGLAARWSGTVSGTPRNVVVTASDCVDWQVAAVTLGGMRLEGLTPPCLRQGDDGSLLDYEVGDGRTAFSVATDEAPLDVRIRGRGHDTRVAGTWPALALSGAIDADGIDHVGAAVSGGALSVPAANLAVEGLAGSVDVRADATVSAALGAASVTSLSKPALWAPVALDVTATGDGAGLSFDALASDDLGIIVLEATGRYADGAMTSALKLYPIELISGATEVADLSPLLADHVTEASGSVAFEGELALGPDGASGAGTLTVRDFAATIAGTAVTGVDSETRLDALVPPSTAPSQSVSIESLNLGVPLDNGIVEYDLDAGGRLAVERVAFDLAGGRIYAEPFTVDSGQWSDIRFVLRAEDVELAQMLSLSRIEGLQGTGVLSGRVPVRIAAGVLQLDDGVLAAETDGVLRYTPDDLPAFLRGDDVRSRMLREALTNFQYDELSLSVDGESGEGGEQRLTLAAKGANPDFLDGHPIELNFNFRGPLLGAMRSAVDVSGAGDIEDLFEEQEGENVETIQ